MPLVAMVLALGWVGTGTAGAQTRVDENFSGTHENTEVVPPGDLALRPALDAVYQFDGSALPAGWAGSPWASGGSATVGGGNLTVDGARANTSASFGSGRSLDFTATFSGAQFQHVGFGQTLGDAAEQWAIFSTGSSGGQLFARTNPGGASVDQPLPAVDLTEPHDYSIEWTSSQVRYLVDGLPVHTDPIPVTARMRPIASDLTADGGTVQVASLAHRSYRTAGTFTSRVFDAGDSRATWRTLTAAVDAPPGTGVAFEVRLGSASTPNGSWTGWQPVGPGGSIPESLGRRYLQYRAKLTSDGSTTPFVRSVSLSYTTSVVITPPPLTKLPSSTGVGNVTLPATGNPSARPPSNSARLRLLSPFPVVRLVGDVRRFGTRIRLLSVRAPKGARVLVRCRGRGCPVRRAKRVVRRTPTRLKGVERFMPAGVVLEVLVRRGDRIGKFTRFKFRQNRRPRRGDGCLLPGTRRMARCPRD
jgi:hypothetical protein